MNHQQLTLDDVLVLLSFCVVIPGMFLLGAALVVGGERLMKWLDRPPRRRRPKRARRATFREIVAVETETPRERARREANELRGWRP